MSQEMIKELVQGTRCVHMVVEGIGDEGVELDPALICGNRVIKVQHGWLCPKHFREQLQILRNEYQIPQQPEYYDLIKPGQIDCEDILQKEQLLIRRAENQGLVRRVRFGAIEPEYVTYIGSVTHPL